MDLAQAATRTPPELVNCADEAAGSSVRATSSVPEATSAIAVAAATTTPSAPRPPRWTSRAPTASEPKSAQ